MNTTKTKSTQTAKNMSGVYSQRGGVALDEIAQRALALESDAHKLAEQLRMARGTRDLARTEPRAAPRVEVATDDLYRQVENALTDKPHTFRDLMTRLALSAGEENRVKSILVRLQRDGASVVNLGNGSRAIWWIDTHDRIGAIVAGRRRGAR